MASMACVSSAARHAMQPEPARSGGAGAWAKQHAARASSRRHADPPSRLAATMRSAGKTPAPSVHRLAKRQRHPSTGRHRSAHLGKHLVHRHRDVLVQPQEVEGELGGRRAAALRRLQLGQLLRKRLRGGVGCV